MPFLDDLAAFILSGSPSLGLVDGETLVKGRLPEEPHTCVGIIPYGGLLPQRTHSGTDRRHPRFQVVSRSHDPQEAYALTEAIRAILRAVPQQQVGPIVYEAILPISEANPLARDTLGRTPVAINFEARWHLG